jgi:hypothetical protein
MGQDDATTDQSQMTQNHSRDASGCTPTCGGRQGEPLFRRFAVPKEWRTKDGAVG